jgi:hypothetical protein
MLFKFTRPHCLISETEPALPLALPTASVFAIILVIFPTALTSFQLTPVAAAEEARHTGLLITLPPVSLAAPKSLTAITLAAITLAALAEVPLATICLTAKSHFAPHAAISKIAAIRAALVIIAFTERFATRPVLAALTAKVIAGTSVIVAERRFAAAAVIGLTALEVAALAPISP